MFILSFTGNDILGDKSEGGPEGTRPIWLSFTFFLHKYLKLRKRVQRNLSIKPVPAGVAIRNPDWNFTVGFCLPID